jgi:adenosylhomocysteinase
MDLAFGIEALALAWLAAGQGNPGAVNPGTGPLPPGVHQVPSDIDAEAARLVLHALGTRLDTLSAAQQAYQDSWHLGS